MRFFFRRHIPHFHRVLIVESGSRFVFEKFWKVQGAGAHADLVTCFAGSPDSFPGPVFRVQDYSTPDSRKQLVRELIANRYDVIGILCTGEPIMTKWKWMLAARIPAKLFVVNENGDWFWVDYSNWRTIWHFASFRAGLSGAGVITTPARLILFPFTLLYLLLYALRLHALRFLRGAPKYT